MNMNVDELDNGIRRIVLDGRLDMAGAQEIDMKFTGYAASAKNKILVDLSKVEFIASIGIRTLLTAAKAQKQRGGAMVLSGAQPLVAQVIETAGLTALIPSVADEAAAIALLNAS
jgi:anti-sigma B factor antagonist